MFLIEQRREGFTLFCPKRTAFGFFFVTQTQPPDWLWVSEATHYLSQCLASRATPRDALCREGETHCRSLADALARALHAGVDQHKSYICVWHCVW